MIELNNNELIFSFPEVHPKAKCRINFQRTLRIPDDNREYPLPPGLGQFPVMHVDDYATKLPESWRLHGGVFLPMYQSEALWINFGGYGSYPCAVKIAAGKINAVSGKEWNNRLCDDPQDYVVTPDQPWLDGFNVTEDHVRQFVAMPLGEGFTAEEQLTGHAKHGGLQIIAYPMKREVYAERFEIQVDKDDDWENQVMFLRVCEENSHMGLAPGGLMRQEVYKDEYGIGAWDQKSGSRCFVHLTNSEMYQAISGHIPPHKPFTAKEYTKAGLPWFDYYSDNITITGSSLLSKLSSVAVKVIQKGGSPLNNNDSLQPAIVKKIGNYRVIRDGDF